LGEVAGELALTFDDGPDPVDTRRLLGLLDEHGIGATFFVFGEQAALYPDVVREVVAAGHDVQPHCWSHVSHHALSGEEIAADIDRVLELLGDLGVPTPALWRPPHGHLRAGASRRIGADRRLALVGWTVTVVDWHPEPGADLFGKLVGDLDPGALNVVLMHDGHTDTGQTRADASNTIDALGLLLGGPPRAYVLVEGGVDTNLCEHSG
jgi:peptidoglycan-N-acetylglucosamine deacetylase